MLLEMNSYGSEPIFSQFSYEPYLCGTICFLILCASLTWVRISAEEWKNVQVGTPFYRSAPFLQTLGWLFAFFDMLFVTIGLFVYPRCPSPFIYKLPPSGDCITLYLVRGSFLMRIISTGFLGISVMLRFQPIYEAFGTRVVHWVSKWIMSSMILVSIICILIFCVYLPYQVEVSTGTWEAFGKSIEFPFNFSRMLGWAIIHSASAWFGIRFILQRFKLIQQDASNELFPPVSLCHVYFCVGVAGVIATVFAVIGIGCSLNQRFVSKLVEVTLYSALGNSGLLGSMHALIAINDVLKIYCRKFKQADFCGELEAISKVSPKNNPK
jgi:hypothetical protein